MDLSPNRDLNDAPPPRTIVVRNVHERITITVDASDYDSVSRHAWYLKSDGQVFRFFRDETGKRHRQTLVQFLLPAIGRASVGRKNNDRTDFTRGNLLVRRGEVFFEPTRSNRRPWFVRIRVEGVKYWCGQFAVKWQAEEAHRLAVECAQKLEGRGLTQAAIKRALMLATGVTVPLRRHKGVPGDASLN